MRWGIIGWGWVARDHMAPGIAASGGRVSAVVDRSPAARADAAARGIAAFDTVGAMVAAGICDLAYVATPNDAHLEPVRACVAAGVPVLCEKPLAATLADAEAMAGAVGDTLYGTAFDQRHHPAHRALAQAIAGDAIGRAIAVRIVYACWVGPSWTADNWRADPVRAGGGAVIDLALHGLDLTQYLLAEPLVDLSIMLQRRIHDYPVDDGGMLTARTASGVLMQAHVAYNCPEVLPRRRLEVLGERGLLVATDTMGQTPGGTLVRRCGERGTETALPFDADLSPFAAQAAAFMAAARGGRHDFSMERDLMLMRLFDRAYTKARRCR
ncbi:putative dehydrogenase [Sphingomonas sp. BE138]|uniref:Gfo/Idh/MocA family protein n=1 Tax=Sphingomonas sp. BE138 TaxID=2817845 RepID=UPI00285F69A3|nr:Gfo/Idh/MocA family oxidoreductase [Sphingomonas sp. BE138]MDR6787703.1 putative dehydrogenase [Sphingomonas sp. BE138]